MLNVAFPSKKEIRCKSKVGLSRFVVGRRIEELLKQL
jgi:hypothetical protein